MANTSSLKKLAFERYHLAYIHVIADKYRSKLFFFSTKKAALEYIEWDTRQYGPRDDDDYLHYVGEAPVMHHENKGEI